MLVMTPVIPPIEIGTRVTCESDAPGLVRVNGESGRVIALYCEETISRVAWDRLYYHEGRARRQLVSDIGTDVLRVIV